jgi:hypothetical protein
MKTTTKKNLIAGAAGFGVMLGTAVAAYAIPIPFLRDVLNDHLFALVVWSGVTLVGKWTASVVHRKLP